jgi:uncharacterized protein (UPF0264 family)
MRLLVSVASADEALAAVDGGADIIDAKNPLGGALGAVEPDVMRAICRAVDGSRFVTAALGDANDLESVGRLARELVTGGAQLVKVGFLGVDDPDRVEELLSSAVRACFDVDPASGVVAVGYADEVGDGIDARQLVSIAARAGARGVLVDTADKCGPGLTSLWSSVALATWVSDAHDRGLLAAVAGKLTADDLGVVADAGADIAGVRGAACVGGRGGRVSAARVRDLVSVRGTLSFRAERGILRLLTESPLSGR